MKYVNILKDLVMNTWKVFFNKVSLDFYRRYLFLLPMDITSNMVSKKIKEKIYIPLMKKVKKPFLFVTSFGTFVGRSVDAWARMHKDYESWIRKYIVTHHRRYRPYEHEIYCINIWANQGRRAIELAKNFDYKVIAFEAVPSIFNELMANIYLSSLANKISAYNFALWNHDWMISFHFSEEHEGKSHVEIHDKTSSLQLPIKKFDHLQLPIDYDHIKLFLIDVEWFEYDVLQWMEATLKTHKDIELIVEILDNAPNKEVTFSYMESLWFAHRRISSTDYDYLFYRK